MSGLGWQELVVVLAIGALCLVPIALGVVAAVIFSRRRTDRPRDDRA